MRRRSALPFSGVLALIALGFGTACGSGAEDFVELPIFHVDADVGSDLNPGTSAQPFRTISKALEQVTFGGGTVMVAPGTYDAQHREVFPLRIPPDVALRGDVLNRGQGGRGTSILGFAQITGLPDGNPGTVVMGTGSSISGFVVGQGHFSGYALTIFAGERTLISRCALTGPGAPGTPGGLGTFGVSIRPGTAGCQVRDCIIEGHSTGVAFGGQPTHLLEACVVRDNRVGVRVEMNLTTNGADLGGGVAGSLGGNVIAGNGLDLWILGETHVSARDNQWDHAPPLVYVNAEPHPADADIILYGLPPPTVDHTGANVVSP